MNCLVCGVWQTRAQVRRTRRSEARVVGQNDEETLGNRGHNHELCDHGPANQWPQVQRASRAQTSHHVRHPARHEQQTDETCVQTQKGDSCSERTSVSPRDKFTQCTISTGILLCSSFTDVFPAWRVVFGVGFVTAVTIKKNIHERMEPRRTFTKTFG